MKPTWAIAGHPIPDPGVWPGPVRAAVAAVVFAAVAAASAAWAVSSMQPEQPRPPAVAANPQRPTAVAAPVQPSGSAGAELGPVPAPANAAPERWAALLQAGLSLGLQLEWLRPKGAPLGEARSSGAMSLRIRGRYRDLASWLEALQHLHDPVTVQGLTLRSVDAPALEDPSERNAEPELSLEATLTAGPAARAARPLRAGVHARASDTAGPAAASANGAFDPGTARHHGQEPFRDGFRDPFRDPFRGPWLASASSRANPHGRTPGSGLRPSLALVSNSTDLERGHLGELRWVGKVGRTGEAWTLRQVDGRVQAARDGEVLGPLESRRPTWMEDAP